MRIKAQWFKPEQPRSAAQNASAVAFIAWRTAIDALQRLRRAGFSIDAGPMYLGIVRELLVFLMTVVDRDACERLGAEGRVPFTSALVWRVAEILRENEVHLLGPDPAGGDYAELFVDQFNELAAHYGEFGWSASEGPDFGFVRYLGSRLEPLLPEADRRWVLDQVMSAEAPDAVVLMRRAMDGVFSTAPRPKRRAATSGD